METTAFTRNWIGGDIGAIAALASRLEGYPGQIRGIIEPIGQRVDGLVHDAGWFGDAAGAFRQTWEVEAKGAVALVEVLATVGSVLRGLAGTLGEIEGALERAAEDALAAGVHIGPDGRPVDQPAGTPLSVQQAASTYVQEWQAVTDMAGRARYDANARLQEVLNIVGPPEDAGSGRTPRADELVNIGDYIRGFWSLAPATKKLLQGRIPDLKAARKAALQKFHEARAQRFSSADAQAIKNARRDTLQALQAASSDMKSWEKAASKVPLAKLLDVRLSDLGKFGELVRGAAGESELLRSLADIPVVDMVAAFAATVPMTINDVQEGQSWWTALPEELSSNVIGIGAGAVAGFAITAGIGAAVSLPALVVVGPAVVVGGAVAVGVGDFVSEAWHEHLDEDIHQYGIVGGVGHAVANTAGRTANDMVGLVQSTGNLVTGAWHSIFG
jgi:uncharacterized protein YukE